MKMTIETNAETKQVSLNLSEPTRVDDIMTTLFTVQLEVMKNFMETLPKDVSDKDRQALIEHLYDNYNAGASNVLYLFAPDEELRPDLTVEAMKEAEDNYMYRHLNRETRRDIDKKLKRLK